MKWLERLLDFIFKHLYAVCTGILFFTLSVLLITMSAQYIGDKIGQNVLDRKSIEVIFVIDKTEKEISSSVKDLIKTIADSYNIRSYNVKINKQYTDDKIVKPKTTKIIITTNQAFIDKMANQGYLTTLDHAIFPNRTQKYLEFSKYDEYVLAETTINHLKVYLAYTNSGSSVEKTKAMKTLNVVGEDVLRKEDLQPDV